MGSWIRFLFNVQNCSSPPCHNSLLILSVQPSFCSSPFFAVRSQRLFSTSTSFFSSRRLPNGTNPDSPKHRSSQSAALCGWPFSLLLNPLLHTSLTDSRPSFKTVLDFRRSDSLVQCHQSITQELFGEEAMSRNFVSL